MLCSPRWGVLRPSHPVGVRGVIMSIICGPWERIRIASRCNALWTASLPNSNTGTSITRRSDISQSSRGDFNWLSVGCTGRRLTRVSANSELSTFRRLRGARTEREQGAKGECCELSASWLSARFVCTIWQLCSAFGHSTEPGVVHWYGVRPGGPESTGCSARCLVTSVSSPSSRCCALPP